MLLGVYPDPIVYGEERVFELNVATKLATGETILTVSAALGCFYPSTGDLNAGNLIIGSAAIISSAGLIAQRVGTAWVADVIYELVFTITTSGGNIRVFSSLIRSESILNSQAVSLSSALSSTAAGAVAP